MVGYVLKRLFWFIPTLFIVTCIGFFLLSQSPGDPVEKMITGPGMKTGADKEQLKRYWRHQLGLDLPVFYFKIGRLSEPDTLYKIYNTEKQKLFLELLDKTGNAQTISHYFESIELARHNYEISMQHDTKADTASLFMKHQKELKAVGISIAALSHTSDFDQQLFHLKIIQQYISYFPKKIPNLYGPLERSIHELQHNTSSYKNFFPKFTWYGTQNQYHQWLFGGNFTKGIFRGDFGISYSRKEPVILIIKDKILLSMLFAVLAIVIAYLISVPVGVHLSRYPNHKSSRYIQLFLFGIYSLPSFFVGILLLMLFANPDVLSIFPPSGIKPIGGYGEQDSIFDKITDSLPYMVLPLICYVYASLAFISRLTSASIQEQLSLDYIKTATAKGLTDKSIIWKHAFRNSLLPLITVFSSLFPALIGGSVIIESIFTIPGMGLETVRAILSQDYPVIIAILTLSSALTLISYLLADLLYVWADPRIRLSQTS